MELFTHADADLGVIEEFLFNHAAPSQIRMMFNDYYSHIIYSDQKMNIMRMLSRIHEEMVGEPLLYEATK